MIKLTTTENMAFSLGKPGYLYMLALHSSGWNNDPLESDWALE